ncbi:MAG TPA: SCO family protein [Pseudogracilibacillus sp.]|nr:SCO family protein [Pseudogracilibacillus sp.]
MIKKGFFFIGILTAILMIQGCSEDLPIEENMSETVNDFSFTNQDEESVSLDDLKGDWWIADFVFTNCETVCTPMTGNMTSLQEKLQDEDANVRLVSFSVDPDYDSPDVLKEYGEEYDADFASWDFLTGYDFKTIKKLSIKSFRSLLQEPEPGDDQVTHGTNFYLVDPDGNIVKNYNGVEGQSKDKIMEDIVKLKEKDLL